LSFFSDATAMVAATAAAFFFAAGSLYTALRLVSAWPSLRSVLQGSGEPQAVGEVETLSPARYVLEDTSHQTRPKIDAGDSSLLMGSMN
jgi:hypothetical protein